MTPELSNSGVPLDEVRIAIALLDTAAAKMREVIRQPKGKTAASRQWRVAWAASKMQQVDALIKGLGGKVTQLAGRQALSAAKDGVARAEMQAKEAGVRIDGSGLAGSFNLVDLGPVKVLAHDIAVRAAAGAAGDMAGDLSKAAACLGEQAKTVLRQTAQLNLSETDIDTVIAGGVIAGTPRETTRALKDLFAAVDDGTVAVRGKDGTVRNYEAGYYASIVVRTKTRQANEVARHGRLSSLGLDLVSVVGRISNNFCTAYLGQIFSISGRSDKYEPLPDGGPPWHPNCTKSTRPFIEALAEPEQLDAGQTTEDTRALIAMKDNTARQRAFKDLQLKQQVEGRYGDTAAKLFKGRAA